MPPAPSTTPDQAFDPDALRDRYRRERDKRLRPDANDQYVKIAGPYAHYLDDPYVSRMERPPRHDTVTMVVIGGGLAGLIAGARLRQAGIDDFLIIEKGGGFGGTWYWNRYPGAQCDVESYIYLPLLEETGYVPTEKYSHAPEILEHCDRIAERFGLKERACFSTEVTGLEWDPSRSVVAGAHQPGRRAASPVSSPWATVRSTARSCRASRVSRPSPAIRSTPAGGTTSTPAATRAGA